MNTQNTFEQDRESLLTAYALNELDEPSRAQVEKEFLQKAENLAFVDQTRALAAQLTLDLKAEAAKSPAGLREDQVAAIEKAMTDKPQTPEVSGKIIRFPRTGTYGLLALAACITFTVIIVSIGRTPPRTALAIPNGKLDLVPMAQKPASEALLAKDKTVMTKQADAGKSIHSVLDAEKKNVVTTAPVVASTASPEPSAAPAPAPPPLAYSGGADSLSSTASDLKSSDATTKNPSGSVVSSAQIASPVLNKEVAVDVPSQSPSSSPSTPMNMPMDASKALKNESNAPDAATGMGGTAPVRDMLQLRAKSAGQSAMPVIAGQMNMSRLAILNQHLEKPLSSQNYHDGFAHEIDRNVVTRVMSAPGNESYAQIEESSFVSPLEQPLSTFGLDVDTASYSNVRRFLQQGQLPPPDAVRIEEMLNYFNYRYPKPATENPFSVSMEVVKAPWAEDHLLARVGFRAEDVSTEERKSVNIVFLIDVSGSMDEAGKLPLVQQCMRLLTRQLKSSDHVAIVTYAGESRVLLNSTSLEKRDKILTAIDSLSAGGSTNGEGGIKQAYQIARENFIPGGINRIVLCTDGDFNVGESNPNALGQLIAEKAKSGVELCIYGFGMGNLKDATMEQLAMNGHGVYGYIDSGEEALNTFVQEVGGSLVTVAKDVKMQVEFNPAVVASYRLIGYDHRRLAAQDFNNDAKSSGNITAGHTVTALYEIIPVGKEGPYRPANVDALKYQPNQPAPAVETKESVNTNELMTVKIRYKKPTGDQSIRLEIPVAKTAVNMDQATPDTRFATAVAAFGLLLRQSEYRGSATWRMVEKLAEPVAGDDEKRQEFLELVRQAEKITPDNTDESQPPVMPMRK